jgi:hypothetical protein
MTARILSARIQGRELEAEHLYEQAIRSAHENGFVNLGAWEAVAMGNQRIKPNAESLRLRCGS